MVLHCTDLCHTILNSPAMLTLSTAHWMHQKIHALIDCLKSHEKVPAEMWYHGTVITYQVQSFPGTEGNAGNSAPRPQGKTPNPAVCQHDRFSIYGLGSRSPIDNNKTVSVHTRNCTAFLRCGHKNTKLVFILTQVFNMRSNYVYK